MANDTGFVIQEEGRHERSKEKEKGKERKRRRQKGEVQEKAAVQNAARKPRLNVGHELKRIGVFALRALWFQV